MAASERARQQASLAAVRDKLPRHVVTRPDDRLAGTDDERDVGIGGHQRRYAGLRDLVAGELWCCARAAAAPASRQAVSGDRSCAPRRLLRCPVPAPPAAHGTASGARRDGRSRTPRPRRGHLGRLHRQASASQFNIAPSRGRAASHRAWASRPACAGGRMPRGIGAWESAASRQMPGGCRDP